MTRACSPNITLEDVPHAGEWRKLGEMLQTGERAGFDTFVAALRAAVEGLPASAVQATVEALLQKLAPVLQAQNAWKRAESRIRRVIARIDRAHRGDARYAKLRELLRDLAYNRPRAAIWAALCDVPEIDDALFDPLVSYARHRTDAIARWRRLAQNRNPSPEHFAGEILATAASTVEGVFKDYLRFLWRLQVACGEPNLHHQPPASMGSLVRRLVPPYAALAGVGGGVLAVRIRNACAHQHHCYLPGEEAVRLFNRDTRKHLEVTWDETFALDKLVQHAADFFEAGLVLGPLRDVVLLESFLNTGMMAAIFDWIVLRARGEAADQQLMDRLRAVNARLQST